MEYSLGSITKDYISESTAREYLNEYKRFPLVLIDVYEKYINFLTHFMQEPEFFFLFFPGGLPGNILDPSRIILVIYVYKSFLVRELDEIKKKQTSDINRNTLDNPVFLPLNNIIIIEDLFNFICFISVVANKVYNEKCTEFSISIRPFFLIPLSEENKKDIIYFIVTGFESPTPINITIIEQ